MDNWESTEVVFVMSFCVYGCSSSYSSNSSRILQWTHHLILCRVVGAQQLYSLQKRKRDEICHKNSETKIYSTLDKSITYILQFSAFTYISHNPITSNQNWYHFVVRNIAHSILFRSALQIFSKFSLLSRSKIMV